MYNNVYVRTDYQTKFPRESTESLDWIHEPELWVYLHIFNKTVKKFIICQNLFAEFLMFWLFSWKKLIKIRSSLKFLFLVLSIFQTFQILKFNFCKIYKLLHFLISWKFKLFKTKKLKQSSKISFERNLLLIVSKWRKFDM